MKHHTLHPRTAVINQKQKNQSKQARHQALRWLAEQFPEAFDNSKKIMPLNVGIMSDILKHTEAAALAGISKSKLREAVVLFTRRLDYLACLKAREMRVDLYGQPVAEVSAEDAERAVIKIKKRIEKAAKNARAASKAESQTSSPKAAITKRSVADIFAAHDLQATRQAPAVKAPVVIVKHKTSRAYDPDAVARLKEKLGLGSQLK